MDLTEYRAKQLFQSVGINSTLGPVVTSTAELDGLSFDYPVMVKAQVTTGGRGKAGGIRRADGKDELYAAVKDIIGMKIKGKAVESVMITPRAEILHEEYLAITLDRVECCPVLLYCPDGGMEIEAHPERVVRVPINPVVGLRDFHARHLNPSKEFFALVKSLYTLFISGDCLLCEINPLTRTEEGGYLAVDGKITVDDSALKRQPALADYAASMPRHPLAVEAEKFNFLYIPCDEGGDIAVMSNGSGMLMSCIDSIAAKGMTVRATLDLGGGATAERIKEAVRIMFVEGEVRQLFINIFGGITRCDEVAGGIRAALEEHGIDRPVIVRFEGTNKDKGLEILSGLSGVTYVNGLEEGVEALEGGRA